MQAISTASLGATDLRGLLSQVASNPPATMVILDSKEKEWDEAFANIRREDPFAIFNLHFVPLTVDQGAGNELREREGWPEQRPRWAILNPEGKVVADGASLPTAAQLADACFSARITSKIEVYRQFLREHPNHEEARRAMLREMLETAERRTRYALSVPESRNESMFSTVVSIGSIRSAFDNSDSGGPSAQQIENLPELTSEADERIWRDYCTELQRYLQGVTWQSSDNANANATNTLVIRMPKPITSAWAIFSPLTRATYSRIASSVEDALARQPSSTTLWRLWVSLQKARATKSMTVLLANLEPSPTVPAGNWPPESIRTEFIRNCREIGDWEAIQDLVEPIWNFQKTLGESLQPQTRNTGGVSFNLGSSFFNQGFWTQNGEAYLEALLMRGRISDAEQMMRTWESGSGWLGAFTSAANIAQKLGLENVSKQWRELGEDK